MSVGPPLLFKGARICASDTLGTMSVGPGVKPVTPALPLAPNKLKLFAVTMLGSYDGSLSVCYFRPDGRLVASDQAIVEVEVCEMQMKQSEAKHAPIVRYATARDWRDCPRLCC